jgi:hypothetical protein
VIRWIFALQRIALRLMVVVISGSARGFADEYGGDD